MKLYTEAVSDFRDPVSMDGDQEKTIYHELTHKKRDQEARNVHSETSLAGVANHVDDTTN